MKFTEITLDNGRLRVEAPYHQEIVTRLRECGGEWDKAARVWWIDAARGDRLLALLPKASYDYAALCVCFAAQDARSGHFAASMAYLGITLAIDDFGAVCATGEAISPLLRDEIAKRADMLRPWVGRLVVRRPRTAEPGIVTDVRHEAPDEEERKLGLWLTGVKNAAKRAEQEVQRATARRPRRKAAKQGELFNG